MLQELFALQTSFLSTYRLQQIVSYFGAAAAAFDYLVGQCCYC